MFNKEFFVKYKWRSNVISELGKAIQIDEGKSEQNDREALLYNKKRAEMHYDHFVKVLGNMKERDLATFDKYLNQALALAVEASEIADQDQKNIKCFEDLCVAIILEFTKEQEKQDSLFSRLQNISSVICRHMPAYFDVSTDILKTAETSNLLNVAKSYAFVTIKDDEIEYEWFDE